MDAQERTWGQAGLERFRNAGLRRLRVKKNDVDCPPLQGPLLPRLLGLKKVMAMQKHLSNTY